jgi:hypothetical protein
MKVRVVRSYAGGAEVGFTVLMTDLPTYVQDELISKPDDEEKVSFDLVKDHGTWSITLTPVSKGLYSGIEAVAQGGRN